MEWLLYYWTCVFSVLELHARYNWWVMAPNLYWSPIPKCNLCSLTCITWESYRLRSTYRMTALLLETFYSGMSDHTGQLWPQKCTTVVLWYNTMWVLQAHIYSILECAAMNYNKTRVDCDFTTHETMALLPKMYFLIRTKSYIMAYELLQSIPSTYTLLCLSKYSGCYKYYYSNTKINKVVTWSRILAVW